MNGPITQKLSTIIANRLFHETDSLSYQDELSGLYSASFLQELLNLTAEKANRYKEPLCLIMLTIEGEEVIIQNHGRQALRWVFREMAKAVKQAIRRVDMLNIQARWASLRDGGTAHSLVARAKSHDVIWELKQVNSAE